MSMDILFDWVCPATLVVAFLATAPWGRHFWWLADACATGTFGLGLLVVPQTVLGFQMAIKLSESHFFVARCLGAVMIGQAVSWALCRNSADQKMFGNHLFARVVGLTLVIVTQLYFNFSQGKKVTNRYLHFAILGTALWWLGSLIQLLRYRQMGSHPHKPSSVQAGLIFDQFVMLVLGVLMFGHPNQMLKIILKRTFTVDAVHSLFGRHIAALMISASVASSLAPGFLFTADRMAHLKGRIATHVLIVAVECYSHFVLNLFSPYHVTPFMLSGFYITFLLLIYFRVNETEKEKDK